MKKGIIILFFIMIVLVLVNEKEKILIPNDAIRFRIIASSDKKIDQELKMTIKDDVQKVINNLVLKAHNVNEARTIINNNLDKVDNILEKYDVSYNVSFGNNYFPTKNYKGITYPAGNYESLVITLGEGRGHNWWCVLFPPLCLLDENNNLDDAEYEFYASKIINKFKD